MRSVPARLVLSLALVLLGAAAVVAADSIVWKGRDGGIDADIDAWALPRVLETITSETGWQVWVEPGTAQPVTAHFADLPTPEALRRLLGDLNFALLPQPDGPSKLFVYRRSVGAATELVRRRPGRRPKAIENELLVTAKTDIDALAKRLGARVVGRIDRVGAYRLRFDDAAKARKARAALRQEGDVTSVETNLEVAAPAVIEPLAMSSPAGPGLTVSPSTDKVVVGLIDTAVQASGTPLDPFLQPPVAVVDGAPPSSESITHGTAMAETILDGIARALDDGGDATRKVPVSIIPIDVYGSHEMTSMFDVAEGLSAALDRHANVINMSLSGENDSPLLQSILKMATDHGVLVFAAAGNSPGTTPTYPAADPGVIAVTAADAQGNVAPWANSGSFVDAIAPGVNVVHFDDRAWLGTGTSFSTSWVSGWAAGYMTRSGPSASTARQQTLLRWGMPGRSQ